MSFLDKAVILPVQPEDIDHYLTYAIPWIVSALDYTDGETSLDDILQGINNQSRQLWIIKDQDRYIAAVVTEIYEMSSGFKIGEITAAGGEEHEKWDHFVDVVSAWFRDQGCNCVQIVGRPGWHRLYKKRGFGLKYHVLRRYL